MASSPLRTRRWWSRRSGIASRSERTGGLLTGPASIVDQVRTYLAGGRDPTGRKVGFGLELPLHPCTAEAAYDALVRHADRVPTWRRATRKAIERAPESLLPGWRSCMESLSRLPRLDGEGVRLHPDATFLVDARRHAVQQRFGDGPDPDLPRLRALYDRVSVTRIHPDREPAAVGADPS